MITGAIISNTALRRSGTSIVHVLEFRALTLCNASALGAVTAL